MWSLNKISAENICAFKHLEYSLNQGITTLIFGNNMDNDSQGSNGSGKSALLECISIGLTGDALRKIKMEEIINDAEDKAYINIELHNDSTNETFGVLRLMERGETQQIICTSYFDSLEEKETLVQSSISDYNKFILDKVGLTKDDVFSNYILSKNKFKSFLSSSDKDKKDIINRFSNGIIVDASIEKLEEDIAPIDEKLKAAETKVANLNGSVSAIDEQIANAINEESEKEKSKARRVEDLNNRITEKRRLIREKEECINAKNERLDELDELDAKVAELEKTHLSTDEAYDELKQLTKKYKVAELSDWTSKTSEIKTELQDSEKQSNELAKSIDVIIDELDAAKISHAALLKKNKDSQEAYPEIIKAFDDKLTALGEKVQKLKKRCQEKVQKAQLLNQEIASLNNRIAGTIVCPKCKHEFVLDADVDIPATKKLIADKIDSLNSLEVAEQKDEAQKLKLEQERSSIQDDKLFQEQERSKRQEELCVSQQRVSSIHQKLTNLEDNQKKIAFKIGDLSGKIENIRTAMFDEMYQFIDDETSSTNSDISLLTNDINVANGSITTFKESIKELDSIDDGSLIKALKDSKKKYERQLAEALTEQDSIEVELNKYKEQATRFVEFKTHLANTKIDSLSHITNEFLEAIGSDIRICFSGYTILKSGKVRDKISISLLRDGVDCGSFDKFSAGERARVELANILALHKLTNVNCDEEKGLDLLVLDEILEAVDENGLANIFEAINQLKITALVVSHGGIAENYPYRTIVNKLNGVSFINEN